METLAARAPGAPRCALDARAPAGATVPLAARDMEAALGALLDNALHATVAAGRRRSRPSRCARGAAARSWSASRTRGAGVAPHLAGRLGEPFLTTKEPGEGMGLGLYLVRTLLAQSAGGLEVAPARAARDARDPALRRGTPA